MNNKLEKIFEIVSFYDKCRWSDTQNYNLINFYSDSLDSDAKLLTHWLCYITNRQMPFERIFEIGGYVFSELVFEYKNKIPINELLNPDESKSFVKSEIKDKYYFIGTKNPNERIITNYPDDAKKNNVIFASRFFPSDYLCILYTLHTLEKFNYSLSYYIATAYNRFKNESDLIQKILFSLYLLTYQNIGQPKNEIIEHWNENLNEADNRSHRIWNYFNNPKYANEFNDEYGKFQNSTRYHLKRAWCSLRDFLKSPEFNPYFRESMELHGLTEIEVNELSDISMLRQLELPGDVWNNNPKFQRCIRNDEKFKKSEFNRFLREYYNDNKKLTTGKTYPEQFDITFDFVPRMCDKNLCDICPIGHLSDKGKDFEKICIDDKNKFCPVTLVGCGYKMMCKGREDCELCKIVEKNENANL